MPIVSNYVNLQTIIRSEWKLTFELKFAVFDKWLWPLEWNFILYLLCPNIPRLTEKYMYFVLFIHKLPDEGQTWPLTDLQAATKCPNCILACASFRAVLPHPSPPLMVSTYPSPLYFNAMWQCQMVAAHRVVRDSLTRDSDALSPSIHPGTNPQPHLVFFFPSGWCLYLFTYLQHKYTPYLQYSYTTYLHYNYITFNTTWIFFFCITAKPKNRANYINEEKRNKWNINK